MTAGAWAPSECPSEQSDPIHEFLQDEMRQRSRLSLVRSLIRFRNKRAGLFRDELFADPCWDMLLDLKMNALQGRSISVSSLCVAARVPPTTALRRIELLVHAGLARRRDDPSDKRRVLIGLTAYASKRLDTYLDDIMLTRIPNCPGSLRPCLIVKTVPHRGKHE
jgi:hypothetical protein